MSFNNSMNSQGQPYQARSRFRSSDPKGRIEELNKRFDEFKKSSLLPSSFMLDRAKNSSFSGNPEKPDLFDWASFNNSENKDNPDCMNIPINLQPNEGSNLPQEPTDFSNQQSRQREFFQYPTIFDDIRNRRNPFHQIAHYNNEPGPDSKVHHIPIHIEQQSDNLQSNESSKPTIAVQNPTSNLHLNSRESTPIGSFETHVIPLHLQKKFPEKSFEKQPQNSVSFNSSNSFPRVIDVPIQISKSPSAPVSSNTENDKIEKNISSNNVLPSNQDKLDSYDFSIADPAIVYPMGYEPLFVNSNQAAKNVMENPEIFMEKNDIMPQQASNENINTEVKLEINKQTDFQNKEKPTDLFDLIDKIIEDLKNYEKKVIDFEVKNKEDKEYKWLDEMITRCVLQLDNINVEGNEELRKYRKAAINEVDRVIFLLESKFDFLQQNDDNQIVDLEKNQQCSDSNISNDEKETTKDSQKKKKEKKFFFLKKKNPSAKDLDRNNNALKNTNEEINTSILDQCQSSNVSKNDDKIQLSARETRV